MSFTQADVPYLRRKFTYEVLLGRFLDGDDVDRIESKIDGKNWLFIVQNLYWPIDITRIQNKTSMPHTPILIIEYIPVETSPSAAQELQPQDSTTRSPPPVVKRPSARRHGKQELVQMEGQDTSVAALNIQRAIASLSSLLFTIDE